MSALGSLVGASFFGADKSPAAAATNVQGERSVSGGATLLPQRLTRNFLAAAQLESFADKLAAEGFGDLEALCDREILDDETLAQTIGMGKVKGSRQKHNFFTVFNRCSEPIFV